MSGQQQQDTKLMTLLSTVVTFGFVQLTHTPTTTLAVDEANWSNCNGLEFEDSWQNNVNYQPGDVVTYGGYSISRLQTTLPQVLH